MQVGRTSKFYQIFRIVCFTFVLLFASSFDSHAGLAANTAPRTVTFSQAFQQAGALLKNGRAQDAWAILDVLLKKTPHHAGVNYLYAHASFATGRINQGLMALETTCELLPNDPELRKELAWAYAHVGNATGAKVELGNVKAQAPELVKDFTEIKLEKLAERARGAYDRLQASGELAVGLMWDSNVNGGVDDLDVKVGALPLRLTDKAERRESLGEYANATVNLGWRLGEDAPYWLMGQISFFGKHYNDPDLPSDRDFTWGRAAVGLRRVTNKSLFEIRALGEMASYDPWDEMKALGGDMAWIYSINKHFQIYTKAGVDDRKYMESEAKDGVYGYAGAWLRMFWGKNAEHYFVVGGRGLTANTEQDYYSYDGWEAMGRLTLNLFEKLDFSPYMGWRGLYYRDAATRLSAILGEDNRCDTAFMSGLTLKWHWTDHLATEVGWSYLRNTSNSDFYNYNQHQVNMGMVFNF